MSGEEKDRKTNRVLVIDHDHVRRGMVSCTVADGGYHLGGPTVYGILVQLGVDQAYLHSHALLLGQGTQRHGLLERLLAQLEGLVKVLDALGDIQEHVGVLE